MSIAIATRTHTLRTSPAQLRRSASPSRNTYGGPPAIGFFRHASVWAFTRPFERLTAPELARVPPQGLGRVFDAPGAAGGQVYWHQDLIDRRLRRRYRSLMAVPYERRLSSDAFDVTPAAVVSNGHA